MSQPLADTLLELHRDCRRLPVQDFHDWALDLIAKLMPFDSALWGRGVLMGGIPQILSAKLRVLTPEIIQAINEFGHLDTKSREMFMRHGTTFMRDANDPADTPPEFRRLVLDRYLPYDNHNSWRAVVGDRGWRGRSVARTMA